MPGSRRTRTKSLLAARDTMPAGPRSASRFVSQPGVINIFAELSVIAANTKRPRPRNPELDLYCKDESVFVILLCWNFSQPSPVSGCNKAIIGNDMSVPVTGKYVSADKQFSILIESANATNGQIQGSYNASWSPIGVFQTDGNVGTYGWVFSKSANRDGVAPFSIAFSASVRPEPGRPYVLQDHWIGGYQTNNTLLLTGSRSFVNSDGVVESISLGTQTFSL